MFRTISIVAMAGTVAAIAVHWLAVGPRHRELRREPRDVRRLSLWERLVHALTLCTFLTLAVTGFVSAIGLGKPVLGWWGVVHIAVAPAFAVGVAAMMLTWAEDCRFGAHDWEWARGLGGYLGGDKRLPAGRFSADQKARLWLTALLTIAAILSGLGRMYPLFDALGQRILYEVHRYTALLLVLTVIVHIYLRTLANPGTWLAAVSGKVSAKWAERYHPLWWERLQQPPAGDQPPADTPSST